MISVSRFNLTCWLITAFCTGFIIESVHATQQLRELGDLIQQRVAACNTELHGTRDYLATHYVDQDGNFHPITKKGYQ